MEFFAELWGWLSEHTWTVFVISLALFIGTLIALPMVVAYLPADYFIKSHSHWPNSALGWVLRIVKNLAGVLFLLMGVAMLVLPGQGLLTILVGLMLVEFPGKRQWELWLIRRRALHQSISWIRARAGRPPLDYGNALSEKE